MPLNKTSVTTPISLFLIVVILILNHSLVLSELPDDISLNCGSSGISNGEHGRKWIGDMGSKFLVTSRGSKAKLIKSIVTDPYVTARISHQQFGYRFHVSPGQKFIRLYFNANEYQGFKRTNDFFTVKAGPFTLLSNFSASITADSLGVNSFVREFCVNVEENQQLIITFSPSTEAYAFVNGIEIISMPLGLYYPPVSIDVVGKNYQLSIDKNVALEMVHRLNIGGSSLSSGEDTGLYREWSDDSIFFVEKNIHPVSTSIRIKYKSVPSYTAPQKVYQTSWATVLTKQANKAYNFSWKIPVDMGFRYLVRFHFCELDYEIDESIRLRFDILINDQIAEANADVIKWSGGNGIAVFRDYVAMMEGDRMEGKRGLLISLIPKWTENTDTILKGLEVFKLSNPDNNLAGVNPKPMNQVLSTTIRIKRKYVYAHGGDSIASVVIIFIVLVSIIVYQLRVLGEQHGDNKTSASPSEGLSRHFSLSEIRTATNNFDKLLVIGKGGFGFVYKGLIDDGTITVAIKRLNSKSKQGSEEFWTEIDMLTKLRHTHLVSLIGYCDEGREMILVYEYMEHGTLADHLYKAKNNGGIDCDLSWEQKLKICIGAARGLDYLHTGTRHGIIHRDVKTTNILLDNEWVAKVSDFGLCKFGTKNQSHVSTNVKGTFGYMDPEYFQTRRVRKKSDVYAFGVVLLEVLCGRPAVDITLREDCHSLTLWAKHCIKEGKIDELVDPNLRNQISSPCLKVFTEVAYKCLHNRPTVRPTMSDVVVSLEGALIPQNCNGESTTCVQNEEEEEASDDDLTIETVQSDGAPQQEHENMLAANKRSKWKLSKALKWSYELLIKRKKKDSDSIHRPVGKNIHTCKDALSRSGKKLTMSSSITLDSRVLKLNDIMGSLKDDEIRMIGPRTVDSYQKVIKSLKLSYDHLGDDEAKSLFLLCGLFDEDQAIHVERLVDIGMGLQLFKGISSVAAARDRVFALLELLNDCYLISITEDFYGDKKYIKVHDVVRDVSNSIASTEKGALIFEHRDELKISQEQGTIEDSGWISILSKDIKEFPTRLQCPRLELLIYNHYDLHFADNCFEGMVKLHVVDLSCDLDWRGYHRAPTLRGLALQYHKSLRTLCLRNCWMEDLTAIGNLPSLEILRVVWDKSITEVPKEIGKLTNLMVLDLSYCYGIVKISPGVISSLTNLEELYIINSKIDWEIEGNGEGSNASLRELKALSKLHTLHIQIKDPRALPGIPLFGHLKKYSIIIGDLDHIRFFRCKKALSISLTIDVPLEREFNFLLCNSEVVVLMGAFVKDMALKFLREGSQTIIKHLEIRDIGEEGDSMDFTIVPSLLCTLVILDICDLRSTRQIYCSPPVAGVFGKLEKLNISCCSAMTNIFLLSPPNEGPQTIISSCDTPEEEVDATRSKFNFLELKKLDIMNMPKLESFCLGIEDIQFPRLRILDLVNLPRIECITSSLSDESSSDPEESSIISLFPPKVSFHSLEEMFLEDLKNMKEIWCGQLQAGSFYSLAELEIWGCDSLQYVFRPGMAKYLVHLHTLVIRKCRSLKEVIAAKTEEEEEECMNSSSSILPKLKKVVLYDLPTLQRFCHVVDDLEFSELDSLHVEKCPEFKTFAPGFVHTPKLNHAMLGSYSGGKKIWKGDLNSTIQHYHADYKILNIALQKDDESPPHQLPNVVAAP